MSVTCLDWMKFSIAVSKQTPSNELQVGVALVSSRNELICSAYAGEEHNASWSSTLLGKTRNLQLDEAEGIYLTINTLDGASAFELSEVLKVVRVNEIYVGLPDPALTCYLDKDPILALERVHRYPDELQREILEQNKHFYANSTQSIKNSPYYFGNRISSMVLEKLGAQGYVVSKAEMNAHKSIPLLASLLCSKYGLEYDSAFNVAHDAVSDAFGSKYGTYNYGDDTRSLAEDWRENFMAFYNKVSTKPMTDLKVLNIGVGGGHEAEALFSDCSHITFVDIARGGLERVKKQIPQSRIILSGAEDLSLLPDRSQELYVSLRTYNSSFFDVEAAIAEAARVLKANAPIIISVANGFLCPERHCIIPGLIVPGTDFVDIYRGLDTSKLVYSGLSKTGFKATQLYPTPTEIYLSARAA